MLVFVALFVVLFGQILGVSFENPSQLRASNGELRVVLDLHYGNDTLGNKPVDVKAYNGKFLAPTLRVKQNETLSVRIINNIQGPTNIHFHGLQVSPKIDNSLGLFAPTQMHDYIMQIPANHNPGLYWYHAHTHKKAVQSIMNGMAGGIIIEGLLDPYPHLKDIKEQIILLQDIQIENGGVREEILDFGDTLRLVNGLLKPTLKITPNELQLWRIGNFGANLYYNVSFDEIPMYIIAQDGIRMTTLVGKNNILIPPASRVEVLVRAPPAGNYTFRTFNFSTGPVGDTYSGVDLFYVISEGTSAKTLQLPTLQYWKLMDMRGLKVDMERTITFTQTDTEFLINDKVFDPKVVDTTVEYGSLEKWTIVNRSPEMHVFHIHQMGFQVIEVNGQEEDFLGYQDNINVPAMDTDVPGEVKILLNFNSPHLVGTFLYHCHILEHEDGGMMATITVLPPPTGIRKIVKSFFALGSGEKVLVMVNVLGFLAFLSAVVRSALELRQITIEKKHVELQEMKIESTTANQ